jgi:PilZ domain
MIQHLAKLLTPSTPHLAPTLAGRSLFEALVCETHHAAAMTAIVASCIHGALAQRFGLTKPTIARYLPVEPAVLLSLARRSLLDVEPLSETRDCLDEFFLSLRVLRRQLDAFFYDCGEIGAERARIIHGRSLARHANAACHEALRTVRQLEIETPGRLDDLYCEHARALAKLLLEAERGGTPCLTPAGHPFLPPLPQRRRTSRRVLGQTCRLLLRNTILSAQVKDISEGGLGLQRVPFLGLDDRVMVELASGRQFVGTVAWCSGEAAGVRFLQPLLADDPILAI